MEAPPLIAVEELTKHFPVSRGVLLRRRVGVAAHAPDSSWIAHPKHFEPGPVTVTSVRKS